MMAQATAERSDYLDQLKGILILLVVYGHTIQFLVYRHNEGFWSDPAFKSIYMFHMPLFMAVSGFVSFGAMGRSTASGIIKKRFLQLIVPIFCWAVIYESIQVIAAVAAGQIGRDRAIAILPGLIFSGTLNGFWFLQCVFLSTAIVVLLRSIRLDRAPVFAAITILLLFAPDMVMVDHMFKYTFPFFWIGYALAKWNTGILPLNISPSWLLLLLPLSLLCYFLWTKQSYVYIMGMDLRGNNLFQVPFRYASGIVVSAAFVVLTSLVHAYTRSRTLVALGKASMAIYILQSYFFAVANRFAPVYENQLLYSYTAAPLFAVLAGLLLYAFAMGIGRFSLPRKLLLGDYRQRAIRRPESAREARENASR